MPLDHPRTTKFDLRLAPEAKARLAAAAAARSQSLSSFVLDSALARADETLAERRHFNLSAEDWEAFMAALDAPPRALPRLQRLLTKPGPFDTPAEG